MEAATDLTILGSGTCNLVPDKAAASVLIRRGNLRLVYDFGRGTAIRLVEAGLKQDDIRHIFLSHFHPDHVSDLLPYLQAASWSQIDKRTADLTIYGPAGTKEFIHKLFAAFGSSEKPRGFALQVQEVEDGEWTLEDYSFQVGDLRHSRGLRFDDVVVAGDANLNEHLVAFLRGARLSVFDAGHITDDEICELAVQTQVKKMICSHQYRPLDEAGLNQKAQAKGYVGALVVGYDLMKLEL